MWAKCARWLAKVWAMLLKFEREHGIVFDFVMRVRPDIAFLHPLPPWPTWVEAVNVNRAAGLGGLGPGLGMHAWTAGARLQNSPITDYRDRSGAVPLFFPPENCFVSAQFRHFLRFFTTHFFVLPQLDVPADHFTIHTRASAESTFSMAAQYDHCKGTDLSAPVTTHWCCGGGVTSLNIWSILQQHPNGAGTYCPETL